MMPLFSTFQDWILDYIHKSFFFLNCRLNLVKSLGTIGKRNEAEIDEKLSMLGLSLQGWFLMYENVWMLLRVWLVVKSDHGLGK